MQLVYLSKYFTGQETQVWLDYALKCKYIDDKTHALVNDKYDHIIAMIVNMIKSPENWSW